MFVRSIEAWRNVQKLVMVNMHSSCSGLCTAAQSGSAVCMYNGSVAGGYCGLDIWGSFSVQSFCERNLCFSAFSNKAEYLVVPKEHQVPMKCFVLFKAATFSLRKSNFVILPPQFYLKVRKKRKSNQTSWLKMLVVATGFWCECVFEQLLANM